MWKYKADSKKFLKSCLKINKIILEFREHFNKFNTICTVKCKKSIYLFS